MKFKKLSLIGFKSFANKLEVKFGEGITGIVGPNGCGKSNVADAVRWVLGEQSAKLLRGNGMMDVIFNGTKKRNSLSYAEVSLTFDNKGRSLFPSYEFQEVVITRKLFRSGESEYYINGSLCRLRDISDMLRDAGFAREGYTIIGQGRVTELINSKPEDRRAIFEEAAGISKYKFKKTEAERKNERTRANLERIKDAMKGDADRLGPLTRQAEKARQYSELSEKLKFQEINYYIKSYETAADTKEELGKIVADYDAQIREKQAEYETASSDYNSAMEELRRIDENLESYRNELLMLSVDKEKVAGQIELLTHQLNSLSKQNDSLMSANATLGDNYNKLKASADQKQGELNRKTEELKAKTAEYEKLNAEYTELNNRVVAQEEELERARRAMLAAMERKAAVSMSMGELTAERAGLSDRIEVLNARIAATSEKIATNAAELSDREEKLKKLAEEKAELIGEFDRCNAEFAETDEKLRSTADELVDTKREYSMSVVRKNMLAELQNSLEGYAVPVRKLLNDAKSNIRIASAVLGVVGQIIKVKEGFETAVEMALGSTVGNIVTKDEDDAKLLIAYLKENRYGRATFLPITSFKPRAIDDAYLPLLKRDGCYGVATEAVSSDKMFSTVVSGLLGGTVIVNNMDTAISLAKASNYAFKIVTLDGDVVYPHGSITGGSKKSDVPSVFSYERDLKDITARVDELKVRVDELNSTHARLEKAHGELSKRIRELREDIHDYELAENTENLECANLKEEIESLLRSKSSDDGILDAFIKRLEEINLDIEATEKTQDELGTERREEDDKSHREFDELRLKRDGLRDKVSALNIGLVTLRMDAETLQNDIVRLNDEAQAAATNMEANDMAILGNNSAMQDLNDKLKELTASSGERGDSRREELSAKLSDLAKYKSDLNERSARSDRARIEKSDEISALTEKKHEQEILLTRVDSDMETMQQRVNEEYGLNYEQCLEFKDENYDQESGSIEIAKLKRRISNLGNINMDAIEESQELLRVYHEKEIQCDDLEKSLADEERVIKEMSATMLRDFNECFEKIRVNFQSIFAELFNGGTADLELTDNPDPLLRGVEIKAQPPSKNLQSITLLSGGEKTLTAIAILFAILKLRPMPFCLLDEIEAALDDANVGRFAQYLKKFSQDTQFIVITHRKPTMEQADCLYGVTMEEEGVSTIVSVRLNDAVQGAVSVPAEE
ncbi:MAG: chromosome segregation protein SMC [Clostridiales bacterium]|nr:chromosome segregation protein SMC [Clostridiales bacterium]